MTYNCRYCYGVKTLTPIPHILHGEYATIEAG